MLNIFAPADEFFRAGDELERRRTRLTSGWLHTYSVDAGGQVTHERGDCEDLGGYRSVTGPVITLRGWPTPAMRRAVDGTGTPCAWYIGTDVAGSIIPLDQ